MQDMSGVIFCAQHSIATQRSCCVGLSLGYAGTKVWIFRDALRLYEVNDSIMHVIQWHYLPMIAFGFIGIWRGKVALR